MTQEKKLAQECAIKRYKPFIRLLDTRTKVYHLLYSLWK